MEQAPEKQGDYAIACYGVASIGKIDGSEKTGTYFLSQMGRFASILSSLFVDFAS